VKKSYKNFSEEKNVEFHYSACPTHTNNFLHVPLTKQWLHLSGMACCSSQTSRNSDTKSGIHLTFWNSIIEIISNGK
jgi:hypothetical protein